MKPRLLDLFCGAGGCAKGYQRAGFYVVGVDIEPQPNYCGDDFVRQDALRVLRQEKDRPEGGGMVDPDSYSSWAEEWARLDLGQFDVIHASPPCQAHSELRKMPNAREHPDLVEPLRALLVDTGLPYVIENVVGAPLIAPVVLCGSSLGLIASGRELRRHRLFESNVALLVPPCAHQLPNIGVYGDHARDRAARTNLPKSQGFAAMGMDWCDWRELTQAVPPLFTELIGHQLMQHIGAVAA